MANMVSKTQYPRNVKQIMLADSQMVSFGVVVDATAGVAVGSKKIVKAGTPITGDIEARNTAFTKAGDEDAVGILLHDVDVTEGNANGAIVLFGFVDLDKLDADAFALITAGVKEKLSGKVTFLTGSGKKRSA